MARKPAKIAALKAPDNDWFLRQWVQTQGTTQAELERKTGWDKRKASFLMNGRQQYKRDDVNQAAKALNVEPYELLMHPEDAFALRRLHENALHIAAQKRTPFRPAPVEESEEKRAAG